MPTNKADWMALLEPGLRKMMDESYHGPFDKNVAVVPQKLKKLYDDMVAEGTGLSPTKWRTPKDLRPPIDRRTSLEKAISKAVRELK